MAKQQIVIRTCAVRVYSMHAASQNPPRHQHLWCFIVWWCLVRVDIPRIVEICSKFKPIWSISSICEDGMTKAGLPGFPVVIVSSATCIGISSMCEFSTLIDSKCCTRDCTSFRAMLRSDAIFWSKILLLSLVEYADWWILLLMTDAMCI